MSIPKIKDMSFIFVVGKFFKSILSFDIKGVFYRLYICLSSQYIIIWTYNEEHFVNSMFITIIKLPKTKHKTGA